MLAVLSDDVKKEWDDVGVSVLSAAGMHVAHGTITFKLLKRKFNYMDVEFDNIDEAVGDDDLELAKQHILDWTKKFGNVKVLSRGTSGVLQLRISE